MKKLVIIWTWWAWFTAWIYAWRYALNPIIIWANEWGIINENPTVENFPWYPNPTSGFEIMQNIKKQAEMYWATNKMDTIEYIEPIDSSNFKKWYNIKTTFSWEIQTQTIILAIWTEKNKLNVEWEEKYFWRWVSYCATCDGFFYKLKTTAVVGWGDTAFIEALYLSNICKKVYLIHRKDNFKAEPIWVKKAKSKDNIEFITNANTKKLYWDQKLEWVQINQNWNIIDKKIDWFFIAIWMTPNKINWLDKYLEKDEKSYIKINSCAQTNLSGVFAAWDCTTGNCWFRQLINACAEWAVSAESAFKYISKN